jgi:hypothetical protein
MPIGASHIAPHRRRNCAPERAKQNFSDIDQLNKPVDEAAWQFMAQSGH